MMQNAIRFLKIRGIFLSTLLLIMDIVALLISFGISLYIRMLLIPILGGILPIKILISWHEITLGIYLLLNILTGMYSYQLLSNVSLLRSIVRTITFAFTISVFVIYLLGYANIISRLILFMNWFLGLLLVLFFRIGFGRILASSDYLHVPAVIVAGSLEEIIESKILPKLSRFGYSAGIIFTFSSPTVEEYKNQKVMQISEQTLSEIDLSEYTTAIYIDYSENEIYRKSHVKLLSRFFKELYFIMPNLSFGNIWLESYDIFGDLALRLKNQLMFNRYQLVKRVIDVVLSLILFFPACIVFLVFSILIKLESPGPVVIVQKRIGKDGKNFQMYKFRTMYNDATQSLENILAGNIELKNEYEKYRKLKNDPRVMKVGKFLRKYSLDEMPQLINVLKGEMSLVGPRPYLPEELEGHNDFLFYYNQVLPGMTGWWQVMARNHTSFENRLSLDEYYINNWSIWMDLYILIKTVFEVISGKGY